VTEKMLSNIADLCESIDQNRASVEAFMRSAGIDEPDPLIVDSMAKYWPALELLAAE
jgi:hypothetical protein